MARQAVCKAVEVELTDSLIVTTASGPVQTINPSKTLFPNVLALWADIINQDALTFTQYLNDDFKCAISLSGTGPTAVVSGTLAPILGFTGSDSTGSELVTATYTPTQMWISTYQTSDTNWFNERPEEMFRGSEGADGNLSGVAYTARKRRVATWPWEFAYNAIEGANSATSFQSDRSFTNVVHDARQMVLAEAGSNNLYCKGVYFVPDLSTFTGLGNLPTTWDSGSTTGSYIFCAAGPPVIAGNPDSQQRVRYDLSLDLTSAVAPAWGWDIS